MLQLPNLKYFGKLNKIFKIIKVNRNLKNKTISYLIPMVDLILYFYGNDCKLETT